MYMTPEEYCRIFRCNLPSLYSALRRGKVPGARKVAGGRMYRIFCDDPEVLAQILPASK